MEQNKIDKISKAVKSLKSLCTECEISISKQPSKGASPFKRCPFRSISNEHCDDFDAISQCLNRLAEVVKIVKLLKDQADYLEECTDGETSDIHMAKYIAYDMVLRLINDDDFFNHMQRRWEYELKHSNQ